MAETSELRDFIARVAADQRERLRRGERVPLESYLAEHPEWLADERVFLRLVVAEFVLRKELGDWPTPEDYQRRFPQWAARLAEFFESGEWSDALRQDDPPAADGGTWSTTPSMRPPTP